MQPTQLNERIDVLDILRGFALVGIIFLNSPPLLQVVPPIEAMDARYYYFLQIFVESKFFTIFSFLFGIGFYLFLSRAIAKGEKAYSLFARRLFILLLLGIVHMMYHPGEALSVYAIYGFVLMVCYKLPKQVNLIVGLLLLAATVLITAKVLMPLPLILLGLTAGQYGIFEQTVKHRKKWLGFTAVMFVMSIGFWVYQLTNLPALNYFTSLQTYSDDEVSKYILLGNATMWAAPFVSSFYVGVVVLLAQTRLGQRRLAPLKHYGRMALTNYIAQTVLILSIGALFQLNGSLTYIQSALLCIGIVVFLMIVSKVWLAIFNYGPLEWLWRIGTYLRYTPVKK